MIEMIFAIVLLFSSFAGVNSVTCPSANVHIKDTVDLLVQQNPVLLTNKIHTVKIPLHHFRKTSHKIKHAILLTIEIGAIETLPDGVYEIYLGSKPRAAKSLESNSTGFINLLDLYVETSSATAKTITLDVSNQVNALQEKNISIGYCCFQFKGLTLANGKAATNAGRVWVNTVRISGACK